MPGWRRSVSLAFLLLVASPAPAAAAIDPQVAGLQVALQSRGLYGGPVDAIHGPATSAAVVEFQRRAGLQTDGVAGRQTRKALGKLGRPLYGKRVLQRGAVGWDVSVLQFLLRARGFRTGGLDGDFGPGTEKAVRRFQRASGLATDGIVGAATRRSLAGESRIAVVSDATPPEMTFHRVQAGDSLSAIAARYGTTVRLLAQTNDLDLNSVIVPGQRLAIPSTLAASRSYPEVRRLINRLSNRYGLDSRLVRALAWVESGFQQDAVSSAGAVGVMQITPPTWEFVETVLIGKRVRRTTAGNIRVGIVYLRFLLNEFNGDVRLALGAYNQGLHAVRKRGLFNETERFVKTVVAHRGLV